MENQQIRISARRPLFNGQLEESDEESVVEGPNSISETDFELNEYAREENSHNAAFGHKLRISCVPHSLQCSLREVVEADPDFSAVKSAALSLIHRINRSTTASSRLASKSKLSLLKPAQTRWNCIFYVFDRLLVLRQPITEVMDSIGWDNMSNTEWRKVNIFDFRCLQV